MTTDFRLPDLGEGLPEAELVQWLVAEGDTVTLNQTIAEVETAKAVVELPSPYAGVIGRLHAAAGDVVAVGSVLVSYELEGATAEPEPEADAETASEEKELPNLVGYGAAATSGARPARRARRVASGRDASSGDIAVLEAAPHDAAPRPEPEERVRERPRSTPPVRLRAKQLGVDLALVEASGISGLITRADVEEYAARVTAPPAVAERSAPMSTDRVTRTPIRGVRKATAEAMVSSAFTAPHVTVFLTVDATATTELIASLREDRELAEHRIGILAVLARAVCLNLARFPELNSRWDAEAGEIVQHGYVNLGIAAATQRGLVVPHIADADALGVAEMADAIRELAETARAGRTAPAAMRGGTFSITNIGVFGVDAGTPIINPGEAAILALGAVRRQPWEHRGEVALRDVVTLALSFDHRLVDGEQGARFLAGVGEILREPGRALLHR